MIKLSDHLDIPSMGEVVAEREAARRRMYARRTYAAAKGSRLNSDWEMIPTSGQYELRTSCRVLRARARQQARDNGNIRKFLDMIRRNVVGANGIQLQSRASFLSGGLDTRLNKRVEDAFREWSKKQNCTVTKKQTFIEAQKLAMTTLARDGECLVQKIRANNPFGFALKFIDVSFLDETFNQIAPNGNRIIMSVELDADDAPVAYYLTTPSGDSYLPQTARINRVRVPAEEMIHFFMFNEDSVQTRGVTWFHAALRDAKDLDGYKVGVISSARAAAYTFGILKPPPDQDEIIGGAVDENGQPIRPALELALEPLTVQEVPPGYELDQFDPKQPTQNHSEFYKSIMHDLATALGVNYFSLSGDLSSVNYSTARVGLLDERDVWKSLQTFLVDYFLTDVYDAWLLSSWLAGGLSLTPQEYAKVRNPNWRARGWSWIDPEKEINAQVIALENNLQTMTGVLGEQGVDIEDHFATLQAEKEMAAKYGIELKYGAQAHNPKPRPEDQPPPDENRYFDDEMMVS